MLFRTSCVLCRAQGESLCSRCRALFADNGFVSENGVVGCVEYRDVAKVAVLAMKGRNDRRPLAVLSTELVRLLGRRRLGDFDMVTWVPGSFAGRSQRGYDLGRLLAKKVARRMHIPYRATLVRRDRSRQSMSTRELRLEGVRLVASRRITGAVLLVDDVCTTGSSLDRATEALIDAGATTVTRAALAITPRRYI